MQQSIRKETFHKKLCQQNIEKANKVKAERLISQKIKKGRKKRESKKYFSIFAGKDCKNIFIITLLSN
jgi:hypothetical protein